MITQTSPQLRFAIIGCGRMGAFTSEKMSAGLPPGWLPLNYAETVRTTLGIELIALCDRDPARLSEAANKHGVKRCYTDHHALLEEEGPDIVVIATRTPERCAIIQDCVNAGVRGLHFEKPLATNMADARRALSALSNNSIPFSFGTLRRFSETYRLALAMIESGEIGELLQITLDHGYDHLLWGHPHSIDLLMYFARCHEVEGVQATCTFDPKTVSEDRVDCDPMVESAFIRFSNGVGGTITRADGYDTRLHGTKGTLAVLADGTGLEFEPRKDGGASPYKEKARPVEIKAPSLSCSQRVLLELAEAVSGKREAAFTLDEIEASQQTLLAVAYSAIAGGATVVPKDVPETFTVTCRTGDLTA